MTNPCEKCENNRNWIEFYKNSKICQKQNIEWFKSYQDYSSIYNNTVVSLGYAALLFIFSSVKDDMSSFFIKIFGFFFLFSAALFVISELHENLIRNKINSIVSDVNSENPSLVLDAWFAEYNKLHGTEHYKWIRKYLYFWASAITGVIAGLMIIVWCFFPEIFQILKAFLALFYV